MRILNFGGGVVVNYTYDAWGNVLSVTGSMADTLGAANPFRYRGYYYDTETGWYYLQSRYYDPQVGRFINADGIIGANGGITGYNMFAYCNNNPVMYVDPSGMVCRIFEAAIRQVKETLTSVMKKVANYAKRIRDAVEFAKMEASDQLLDLIIDYEAFTEQKIIDGNNYVIGYGYTFSINDIDNPWYNRTSISREEAYALLSSEVSIQVYYVKKYANECGLVLTQQQFDAYVLYGYNAGYARIADVMELMQAGTNAFAAFNYRLTLQKDEYKLGLYRRWYDSAQMYVKGDYKRDYPLLP